MKDGPLGEVEYRAFLNMWLCIFIFYGKANEPTLNHIVMATHLAGGKRIPMCLQLRALFFLKRIRELARAEHAKTGAPWRKDCRKSPIR
jgi:hypothetical protein